MKFEHKLSPYVLCCGAAFLLTSCLPLALNSKPGSSSVLASAGYAPLPPSEANAHILAGSHDSGNLAGTPGINGGQDGGVLNVPTPTPLSCDTRSGVLDNGQTLTVHCTGGGGSGGTSYTLTAPEAPAGSDIGVLVPVDGGVSYTAPKLPPGSPGITVVVIVHPGGTDGGTLPIPIKIVPPGEIGIIDDGTTRGAVGNVFQVEPNTPQIPNLDLYTPVQTVVVANLDIPNHDFSLGFPGVRTLVEWFCIRFDGRMQFPVDGTYTFDLTADDGAIFYLDDSVAVNNDGIHSVRTVRRSQHMTAGLHRFRVDYYQGPRNYIAMQLSWQPPGATAMAIIPPDNFFRP